MDFVNRDLKLVTIEGDIGSGKSYLLKHLQNDSDFCIVNEPLDTWTSLNNDGKNLLEYFYEDKERWSYTFQNCALLSRFKNLIETIRQNPHKTIFVTERCIETDRNVFAKMLYDSKHMSKMEYDMYLKWYDLVTASTVPLSGIIHVKTSPELSLERIKMRARDGELNIPLEYLQSLDDYHYEWFKNVNVPIIHVNSEDTQKAIDFIQNL
jgi:deoxyadenosine/deoxycytidine kinase